MASWRRDPGALAGFLGEHGLGSCGPALAAFGASTAHDLLTLLDEGEMREDLGCDEGQVSRLLELQQAYAVELEAVKALPPTALSADAVSD